MSRARQFEGSTSDATDYAFISPRFRSFIVATNGYEILRYSGIDATPEDVLRQRARVLQETFDEAPEIDKKSPYVFVNKWGHEVLWEGSRVIAVLIPRYAFAGDVEMDVYRMDDRDGTRRRGRIWDETDDEKDQPKWTPQDEDAERDAVLERVVDAEDEDKDD